MHTHQQRPAQPPQQAQQMRKKTSRPITRASHDVTSQTGCDDSTSLSMNVPAASATVLLAAAVQMHVPTRPLHGKSTHLPD